MEEWMVNGRRMDGWMDVYGVCGSLCEEEEEGGGRREEDGTTEDGTRTSSQKESEE